MKPLFLLFPIFFCFNTSAQDLSKLSFAELDSLLYLSEDKSDLNTCVRLMEFGQAKAKAEFGELNSVYADYTGTLGHYYRVIGDFVKAEKLILEAKDIQIKVLGKEHSHVARSFNELAYIYRELGQFDKSETYHLNANKIWKKVLGEDDTDYAVNLNSLATLYKDMGLYEKAEPLYVQAKEIIQKKFGQKHPYYAITINDLAFLYRMMGRYEVSEALFLQAKDIFAKTLGENNLEFGRVLNNLANLYRDMGSYDKVEPLYLQSTNIALSAYGDGHPNTTPSLNNLANLYIYLGDYEKAEPLLLKSSSILELAWGKENLDYIGSLYNLASLYKNTKRYDKAEMLYLKTIEVRGKFLGKEHPDYANSLNSLAKFYQETKKFKKSQELLTQVVAIRQKVLGKEHPDYANSLIQLAVVYELMDSLEIALDYCYQSIDANSPDIDSTFTDWNNLDKKRYYSPIGINAIVKVLLKILMKQYKKLSNKGILEQHYQIAKAAMRLNENIRNGFSGEGDKLRTLKDNTFFVQEGIKTALLLDNESYKNEAFSFAELNKSILLADAIKSTRARNMGDLPDSLLIKEVQLQEQLTTLKKQQYEAKTTEEKDQNNKALVALNLELDAFVKSIKDQYPKYHALKYENITAQASTIQKLLDDKSALLEYFLTDSCAYLFVITKSSIKLHSINIPLFKIKAQIKLLREALSNYSFIVKKESEAYNRYTETAHWFYKEMLSVGLKDKNIQNLIIVTDGELGHLPFETFLVESAPQKINYKELHYLLNDFSISYNYSATLFATSQQQKNNKSNGKMLACAASYSTIDSTRLPYFIDIRNNIQPLPAAQNEIVTLSKNFEGIFCWNDSTNEQFFKKNAANYGIIHLAMHGILEVKQPMISSLVFSENRDSTEDNFLQAFEIARLNLNADLVVLSACETGYGKFEQGEGVVSLARSFMYAGVPSLVVSLWQVNDGSTAIIMEHFYNNLANGLDKASALRKAKLEYMQEAKGILAHPAFWSPFIQLGDSKAIYLKTKGGTSYWILGVIGIISVLLTLVFWFKKNK